jgi:hypothetical protein
MPGKQENRHIPRIFVAEIVQILMPYRLGGRTLEMNFETFFTIEEDGSEGLSVWIKPTRYLERLHPHQAVNELEDYIEILHDALFRYQDTFSEVDLKGSENVRKIQRLIFEVEACQDYIAHLREHYRTMH